MQIYKCKNGGMDGQWPEGKLGQNEGPLAHIDPRKVWHGHVQALMWNGLAAWRGIQNIWGHGQWPTTKLESSKSKGTNWVGQLENRATENKWKIIGLGE